VVALLQQRQRQKHLQQLVLVLQPALVQQYQQTQEAAPASDSLQL
jgi:hypothetical protein